MNFINDLQNDFYFSYPRHTCLCVFIKIHKLVSNYPVEDKMQVRLWSDVIDSTISQVEVYPKLALFSNRKTYCRNLQYEVMLLEWRLQRGWKKLSTTTLYSDKESHPRVKHMQSPWLGKPHRGLQIFDTRVDFPVPVQCGGRFYQSLSQLFAEGQNNLK